MKWLERILWLAVIVIVILCFRSCSGGSGNDKDAIVSVDTAKKVYKKDSSYIPQLKTIRDTIRVKGKPYPVHDTLESFDVIRLPVDTAAILQQFYQQVEYEDVQPIQYGTVTINDTVSQNRITGRRLQVSQTIPEITKTITKVDRRTVGYIGGSILGTPKQPLYAIGADLSFKFKNDMIYSIGIQYGRGNVLYYTGGFKKPIHLRKK